MGTHELQPSETAAALQLAWEVFSQFEAPVYSAQDVEEFRRFLRNPSESEPLRLWVCLQCGDRISAWICQEGMAQERCWKSVVPICVGAASLQGGDGAFLPLCGCGVPKIWFCPHTCRTDPKQNPLHDHAGYSGEGERIYHLTFFDSPFMLQIESNWPRHAEKEENLLLGETVRQWIHLLHQKKIGQQER